jgi:hypothetical protein
MQEQSKPRVAKAVPVVQAAFRAAAEAEAEVEAEAA